MARINTHIGSQGRTRLSLLTPYAPTPKGEAASARDPRSKEDAESHAIATSLPPSVVYGTTPTPNHPGGFSRPLAPVPTAPLPPPTPPGGLPAPFGQPAPLASLPQPLAALVTPLGLGPTPATTVPPAIEAKTLGSPTLAELIKAKLGGTLEVNQAGKLTVPATRAAAGNLLEARQTYLGAARPDLSGLSAAERRILPYVEQAHHEYPDIPISVLMAQDKQESGFDPNAKSSAGAQGVSQFIPGTAASYGVQYGASPQAIQSQVSGQAHLLHDDNFKADPQGALSAYSGGYAAGDYNNPILTDAKASYSGLDHPTHVPSDVRQQYKAAAQGAHQLGISAPSPQQLASGDVTDRRGETVYVRADAKGMTHWAESALGVQEGSPRQTHWASRLGLSNSQPWCADFISTGLARRGVPLPPNPNFVPSYEKEWSGGHSIGTDLRHAKPGDLIAFSGQHIGLYVGNGEMISGNFGNEVARSPVSAGPAPVSAILRPGYQGGRVAVKSGPPLSGVGGAVPAGVGGVGAAPGAPGVGGATTPTSRPQLALTPLTSPLSPGVALPTDFLGPAPAAQAPSGQEHAEGATQNLLALLGQENVEPGFIGRRPGLSA